MTVPMGCGNPPSAVNAAPDAATALAVSGLSSSLSAGVAAKFIVTATDASGRAVAAYTGTLHVTSTDRLAVLPPDYTFATADEGTHAFSVILNTASAQTLTATDIARSFSASATVTVSVPGTRPNAELYNPATGTWTAAGGMRFWRSGATATLLNDGKIRVLRRALESGQTLDARNVDSIAAVATGLSVDSFRSIATAVEAALKARFAGAPVAGATLSPEPKSVFALRAAFLDSLRVEKLLLRVRAETRQ